MKVTPMKIAVVIRARNAAANLQECLPQVFAQDLPYGHVLEVVVVDNESTDETAIVCQKFEAKRVVISTEEFSWGRALNRGIGCTSADIAILLSADATPCSKEWLASLISRFSDPQVAVVYGRQCPRANAPVDEVVRLLHAFDGQPRELSPDGVQADHKAKRWVCSNACSAVRVSVWREFPFDEELQFAEEKPWVLQVLGAGYRGWYESSAMVLHSHYEGILRFAFREWEIVQNAKRGRGNLELLARYMARASMRRICNCSNPRLGASRIAIGITRLPLELSATVVIAAAQVRPTWYRYLRQLAWS
jgi:rhamnosyltransferase